MFQIYHISALYIGKLPFIINQSEDTEVTHFVTPVAQFPKGIKKVRPGNGRWACQTEHCHSLSI